MKQEQKSIGSEALALESVRAQVDDAMRPANFFVGRDLRLEWSKSPAEEVSWEIFQGRLLDSSQTRARRTFESWQVYQVEETGRSAEPLLAVKLDTAEMRLHVVRAIDSYAWEGYHAGDNVYLSRETRKWLRELVGTICLERCQGPEQVRDELTRLLFQAVVGGSRLPLTSLEAPLPAFTFGNLGYVYRSIGDTEAPREPSTSFQELLAWSMHEGLEAPVQTKLLELLLRVVDEQEVGPAAEQFATKWRNLGRSKDDLQILLRAVFNDIALSPWTPFVERTLGFLKALQERGAFDLSDRADFLAFVLRSLGRHLSAYDLITFHHRGANYPDALVLDAFLEEMLGLAERQPGLFARSAAADHAQEIRHRLRRRALRQGWLLRRAYEGLPVPETPTSPGENARVLPLPRVPDEQIFVPGKRITKLFENDKLEAHLSERSRSILQEGVRDLNDPLELRELGMATFLDRPLGVFKSPGEPDRTPLLSYEAFSRALAERRLRSLRDDPSLPNHTDFERHVQALRGLDVRGLPLPPRKQPTRPDAVSLEDARKAAADFVFLRTTRRTTADFLRSFDFAELARKFPLDDVFGAEPLLIVVGAIADDEPGTILIFDLLLRRRVQLAIAAEQGYECRAGRELPQAGLRVLRVWSAAQGKGELIEHALEPEECVLRPMFADYARLSIDSSGYGSQPGSQG